MPDKIIRRPITNEDRATLQNDIALGSSISEIAAKLGRAETVIRRLAFKMNLIGKTRTLKPKQLKGQLKGPSKTRTSEIQKRNGFYHCPECEAKYSELRFLGRHRTTHGVLGKKVKIKPRKEHNGNGHSIEVKATKSDSSYSATGPKGWTDEAAAGYIFAHIEPIIEDGCKGIENSQSRVTLRISELLSFEVLRHKERNRNLGSTLHLPGMRS